MAKPKTNAATSMHSAMWVNFPSSLPRLLFGRVSACVGRLANWFVRRSLITLGMRLVLLRGVGRTPNNWRCSSVSVPSDDLSSWLSPVRKQAGTGATVPFRKGARRATGTQATPSLSAAPGRRPVGVGRLRVRGFPFVERCGVPLLPSIAARCSRTSRSRRIAGAGPRVLPV